MRAKLRPLQEHHVYVLLIFVMAAAYLCAAWVLPSNAFGFNQLRHLRLPAALACYVGGAALILLSGRISRVGWIRRISAGGDAARGPTKRNDLSRIVLYSLVAVLCLASFWLLRTNSFNSDTNDLKRKFAQDVPVLGAHVSYDEMLELYVHSRFWYYTNRRLGWTVVKSYQVLSVLAGGAFVLGLLAFARRLLPRHWVALCLLVASGGFMQLFFGDAENYTITAALILAYLWAGYVFIEGRTRIIVPSAVLAVAMCFHFLSGWLLPSLLYLYVLAAKRKQYLAMALGVALSCLIVGGTLLFFHLSGWPIQDFLYRSHSLGHGLHFREVLATPSLEHYWEITNLLFLLFPAAPFFVPLLWFRRMDARPVNVFVGLAALLLLVLMYVWNPMLGVYYDWNLFAAAAVPLSLLFAYNFLRAEGLKHKMQIYLGILLASALPSYAWIAANHFLYSQ